MAYVYRHIRLDKNEPFYIGIGTDKKYKRENQTSARRNDIWNKIVAKTEYEIEILFEDLSLEDAFKKEIEFIALYGRKNLGTGSLANLTNGGDGASGVVVKEETRKKISERKKGYKYSEEAKRKLSLAHMGIKHSEETKKKMSETRKGRVFSDEHRKKINEKRTTKVALVDEFGNIIKKYNSIADAGRDNNIRAASICHVVSRKRNSIHKKYFKYI